MAPRPPGQTPGNHQPFRYRTVLEVALLASVIYFFLGAPGLPSLLSSSLDPAVETNSDVAKVNTENLVYPDEGLECEDHGYRTFILSTRPLVVYVEDFLSQAEREALVEVSEPLWQPSTVFNAGTESHDPTIRNSSKALLPRIPVIQCLESRALAFQGWPSHTSIERLWTQRYVPGGHYSRHYDWASSSKLARRVSSFMVYVAAPEEGGGTEFPFLEMPPGRGWEGLVERGEEGKGVVFKARAGSAVFWTNFDEEGRGYRETLHAGLPVVRGTKVGLNIWSWFQKGT